jgi:prepilin-type processing-associated H-X9-DG protein
VGKSHHPTEGIIVAIVVRCECGNQFQTADENAGRRGRCPVCQRELIVPDAKGAPVAEVAEFHDPRPIENSGKAMASMILGLCSFVFCCLTGVPAIVLGIMGLSDINNPRKRVSGSGMATTGIVLGCVSCVLMFLVVPVLMALLLPAVQAAREAARRAQCTNNLKEIALAIHNYEVKEGSYPPAAKYDANGKPLLSWRVLILPYMDQQSLYQQFHLDEPWDSPHNMPLAAKMPQAFACPSNPLAQNMTTYQVIVDPRSLFTGEPSGVRLQDVPDSTSNTLMVLEAVTAVPWSKPEDLSLASKDPLLGMGSKHPGGFNAAMGDGSVQFIRTFGANAINPQALKALVTRNGGETVAIP